MKRLITTFFVSIVSSGCLRYNYEHALKNVPEYGRVQSINNKYIVYSMTELHHDIITTNYYRMYYTSNGQVFKTIQTKNAR